MPVLNQIIAIHQGVKSRTDKEWTRLFREVGKVPILNGMSRVYKPKDEAGERYPSETQLPLVNAEALLVELTKTLKGLFEIELTREDANQEASADVVLGGETLLPDVPVTYLIWLEKKLVDVRTFIDAMPTLDPAERWAFDAALNFYRSDVVTNSKTKRVLRNHVKAPATDKHPAQVETYTEDEVVGYWEVTKFSTATPAPRKALLLQRVDLLSEAVKFAREKANSIEVTTRRDADRVLDYLFATTETITVPALDVNPDVVVPRVPEVPEAANPTEGNAP